MGDGRTYLITGASGFIGGELARHLLTEGKKIRLLVRRPESVLALASQGAEVVQGDLCDAESLCKALQGVFGVYHIAGVFREAGLPPADYFAVNVQGTRLLLEQAERAKVSRFVHCSTVGVLGHVAFPPADENTPYNPGDVYQESKLQGELIARRFFKEGRLRGVVIRPAMVWGPGDRRTLKLFRMIARRCFFYVGAGDALVHFVDVRDLAQAFELAMEHHERNDEVYIIAGARALPLCELVEIIARRLGVPVPRRHLPVKPMQWLGSLCEAVCRPFKLQPPLYRRRVDFFTKARSFNTAKAREHLGYQPTRCIEEEVGEIIEWYYSQGWLSVGRRHASQTVNCSRLVRDISGRIVSWDAQAEELYGWSPEMAVGSISHVLLGTEFPQPIEAINARLLRERIWKGRLVQTTCAGSKVVVESQWLLVNGKDGKSFSVLEKNVPLPESGGLSPKIVSQAAFWASCGAQLLEAVL